MKIDSKFSILIVNGNGSDLSVLRSIFGEKYDLLFSATGQSALETARAIKKPDLIMLDMLMRDMSGFDILAELKGSSDTHNIPVIFILHDDNTDNEEKLFFLGAADYIIKPFHPSTVTARVKMQLELVRQTRMVERYALIDVLVDIPNRRSFDTQLETEWGRAIREKTPINLLMVDVDNFKNYNNTYGAQQGNAALQTIAKVLGETLKRKTDMAFRLESDSFTVILPDTTLGGALRVAEDIRSNVEGADIGGSPSVTVSVGIASATPNADGKMAEFVSAAEKALLGAKDGGKNTARAYTVI